MHRPATDAAELAELRHALLALTQAVADLGPQRCAAVLNAAERHAAQARRAELDALGAARGGRIAARFGAARTLNTLCGACGLCPRGAPANVETVMARSPPASPAA